MARKALLIGTSQYLDGFKPLKSATHDVQALAELLNNPEIGGFGDVQVQTNLASAELAETIEIWYMSHGKDDFVLLFLAGHGVKDADRKLHFAVTNTKKVGEKLITTTAIAAAQVSAWMSGSKASRQIVMLNCCFSGAFGDLVPMDEGTIDLEEAIAAKGRVVMTSTSSMDYAFERLNGELSVYGHYLAEGLRTGAAAAAESDEITIDRLHQYVSRKVQEEAPSMVPKIFAKGEGYQLRIAKVALGDPEVQYRKRVEKIVEEDEGEICEIFSRPILEELQKKLELSPAIALQIEDSVLEPILQYRSKLQRYQDFVQNAVQKKYPFGDRENKRLEQYQNMLGLSVEDSARILEEAMAQYKRPAIPREPEAKPAEPKLASFTFKTCQVNDQGEIVDRTTKTAQHFRQDLGKGLFIDMVAIPGGKFHNIQIPEFFMSKTLITQAQWEKVSKLPQIKIELKPSPSRFKGPKLPVEEVTWWMVEEFCKRLSIKTQQNYQLPAEAQWEYACRSGTKTDYYFGDRLSSEVANYGNSIRETTEVDKYPANAWGLYDMHGNLWEWCADHHSLDFETSLKDSNPILSKDLDSNRVLRGGSWIGEVRNCASCYRIYGSPASLYFCVSNGVGFRVVCSSPRT